MRTLLGLAIVITVVGAISTVGLFQRTGLSDAASASTRSADSGRGACSRPALREAVTRFLRAATRGSERGLRRAIANKRRFRVYSHGLEYSSPPRRFFATRKRRVLIRHLLRRHEKGDLYRLRSIDSTGRDRARDLCDLRFTLDRRIGDGPIEPFVGKGALDAPSGRIAVWNIGGTESS